MAGCLLAGFILVGGGAHPARAAAPIKLNLTNFSHILVDPATSHVYVSSKADNSIVVLDFNGTVVKTITGESGPDGMAVVGGILYVALTTTGAIDRIDTGTLTETSPLVTGLVQPGDIAFAGSKLWTTTGACTGSSVQLVSIDPAAPIPTATTYFNLFNTTNGLYYCAKFATNHATNPSFIVAWDWGLTLATVTSFDVSGANPVQLKSGSSATYQNLLDVAINPDATHFITASGGALEYDEFNLSDMTADGVTYPADHYLTAVDSAASGAGAVMAGGMNGIVPPKNTDVLAYQIGNPNVTLASVTYNGAYAVPARGIAISPDASVAFVISLSAIPGSSQLDLVPLPAAPPIGSPGPPTGVSAGAGVGSATVFWAVPAYQGTSPITGYTIHSSLGAVVSVGPTATSALIAGLTPTQHTFTVTATNIHGTSIPSQPSNLVNPIAGGTYHALTPSRILDTRTGNGGFPIHRVGAGQTLELTVLGRSGVPATGVSAVVMNVTVTSPTGPGYVTAYPKGSSRPVASNLNFIAGQTVPNLVDVAVGTGGVVDLYVGVSSTNLVADVEGWVGDATDSFKRGGLFNPLAPSRILDTRNGNGAPNAKLGAGQSLVLQVAGHGGVPLAGAGAVVLNVTVTSPSQAGYLIVYPTGATRPLASNLNFTAGQTVANRVTVALGSGGVTIFNAFGSVNVIADVNGWYTDAIIDTAGAPYVTGAPARIADTRSCACRLGPGYVLDLQFKGALAISAVVLNVTATNTSGGGYLTVYPDDGSLGHALPPLSSDLNYAAHQTVPNLIEVMLGSNLAFNIYNGGASADVVVDLEGYYGPITMAGPLSARALQANELATSGSPPALSRSIKAPTNLHVRASD